MAETKGFEPILQGNIGIARGGLLYENGGSEVPEIPYIPASSPRISPILLRLGGNFKNQSSRYFHYATCRTAVVFDCLETPNTFALTKMK